MQLAFTATTAVAAIVIAYIDTHRSKHTMVKSVPLLTWLLVATAVWPALVAAGAAVDVSVRVVERLLCTLENIHYMLMGLSRALKCAPLQLKSQRLSLRGVVAMVHQLHALRPRACLPYISLATWWIATLTAGMLQRAVWCSC